MTGQGVKTQKEVKNSAKNPAQYTSAERWSYMQEGKQVFSDAGVIGLTCDAVHIGDSDWLNCILWNADRAVGYVCPPQAGGIGKFQQFLNFVWLHFFFGKAVRQSSSVRALERVFRVDAFSSGIPAQT